MFSNLNRRFPSFLFLVFLFRQSYLQGSVNLSIDCLFLFFFLQIIQHFFESCGFLASHADVLTGSSRNHSWRGMPFLRDEPEASFCELKGAMSAGEHAL